MLAMFRDSPPDVVVSEPDIDAALAHLRGLPYRASMPWSWDRKRFLDQIREAIGARPEVDACVAVAPGVFAIVKPFGVDLLSRPEGSVGRLQVWLAIRTVGTDPDKIVIL